MVVVLVFGAHAYQNRAHGSANLIPGKFRIMFYNVENLFDTRDDPKKNDNEFLPGSKKKWNIFRYKEKLNKIFQVVTAVGEGIPPDLIGLCEVENRYVLYDLVSETPLLKYNYRFLHNESPDARGIDVALLYNPATVSVIDTSFINISPAGNDAFLTREILYAMLEVFSGDTLHVFVNHWPSRYGGEKASRPKRIIAANILKHATDSLLTLNAGSKIIVMGDFNDNPGDDSMKEILGARCPDRTITKQTLYNLMCDIAKDSNKGTLKYRSEWSVFDQIIVSGSLLLNEGKMRTGIDQASIYQNEFLLEKDQKYMGEKPFRTYHGPAYHGGYSDHLPVYTDLFLY